MKKSIRVQKIAPLPGKADPPFHSLKMDSIEPGEIVESISAPSERGRILIRHNGRCYRAWKEELQDSRAAERLAATGILAANAAKTIYGR